MSDVQNNPTTTTDATPLDQLKNGHSKYEEQREKQNVTGKLLLATFAAAVGSAFQHGYNTGVVNSPQNVIVNWIKELLIKKSQANGANGPVDDAEPLLIYSIAVSIYCVGGMMGGLCAGFVSEQFGRKRAIMLNNVFVFLAAAFMGLSKSWSSFYSLIFGRLLVGVNSGLNAGLIPMYLSEISPISARGMIGSSYQLVITISILISQILGMKGILGNEDGWPILFSLIVAPAIMQLCIMPFCPESPKFLASKNQIQDAAKALRWLRGTSDVDGEIDEMRSEFETQKSAGSVTLMQMVSNPMLRIPMVISVVVMLAQQLSGINAVIFYSTDIFKTAKLSDNMSEIGTIAIGVMNVAMTLISTLLVEAAGRKTLLLVGFSGMFIDTILFTIALFIVLETSSVVASYLCIMLLIGFVVVFAIGPGSIPWFLVSELFMQNARPMATSIAVGVNWAANFFVGLGFPILKQAMSAWVFVIFALLQLVFAIFIFKKVPETKNKTTEEISTIFRQMSYE